MKPRHGLLLAMAILCACAAPAPKEVAGEAELIEPKETVEVDAGSLQQATAQEIWAYHAYWMGDAWRQYDLRAFGRICGIEMRAARPEPDTEEPADFARSIRRVGIDRQLLTRAYPPRKPARIERRDLGGIG